MPTCACMLVGPQTREQVPPKQSNALGRNSAAIMMCCSVGLCSGLQQNQTTVLNHRCSGMASCSCGCIVQAPFLLNASTEFSGPAGLKNSEGLLKVLHALARAFWPLTTRQPQLSIEFINLYTSGHCGAVPALTSTLPASGLP